MPRKARLSHVDAQGCPTWFIAATNTPPGVPCTTQNAGASNIPPNQGQRVQSFSTEVAAGTTTALTWAGLKPGTYLLESGGFEAACVTTGPEALEAIRRCRPDLLLTDIQLPEMDGYELGRRLRADPQFHDLPIVALTSYAMPGDRQKAVALGFNGYIEKPINPETFVSEVEQFLPAAKPGPPS